MNFLDPIMMMMRRSLALPLTTAKMNVIEMDFDDEEILETEIDNLVRLMSSTLPSNPSAMVFLDKINRLKECIESGLSQRRRLVLNQGRHEHDEENRTFERIRRST
jgi:hypothetical protein